MVCATDTVRYYEEHPYEFAEWFKKEFAGIVPDLLSEQELTNQFIAHQKIPLKSIKLSKLGYKDNAVLLGDSSHTMTPFHAMGMITGLEDVRIFFQKFRDPAVAQLASQPNGEKTLPPFCPKGTIAGYTEFRLPDVHTMVDLAHEHYAELRHGVRSPIKRARKVFDAALGRHIPALDWTTMYARIQFGNDRFSDVVRKEKKQETIVKAGIYTTAAIVLGTVVTHLGTFALLP
jgi:kynurenine 3-monooxygenase